MGLPQAFYRRYQKIEARLIWSVKDMGSLVYTTRLPVIQGEGKTAAPPTTLFCEFDTTSAGISGWEPSGSQIKVQVSAPRRL